MTISPPQDTRFASHPYWAIKKIEANHRFEIDLELHSLKNNPSPVESSDTIDKTTALPNSIFLELLRTKLKTPLDRSKTI